MKRIIPLLNVFLASPVLAHPGHGEPGLLHAHGEWIILAVALLAWRALRR